MCIGAQPALSFAPAAAVPLALQSFSFEFEFEFCSSALSCQLHVSATFRFRLSRSCCLFAAVVVATTVVVVVAFLLMESGQSKAVKSTTNQVGCCLLLAKRISRATWHTHTKWQTSGCATCNLCICIFGIPLYSPHLPVFPSLIESLEYAIFQKSLEQEKSTTSKHR